MLIISRSTRLPTHIFYDVFFFSNRHLSGAVKKNSCEKPVFYQKPMRIKTEWWCRFVDSKNRQRCRRERERERESNWKPIHQVVLSCFCCLSQSVYRNSLLLLSLSRTLLYSSLRFYRLKMFSCFCSFLIQVNRVTLNRKARTAIMRRPVGSVSFSRQQKNPRDLMLNWLSQIYIQSPIPSHHLFNKNYSTWRRLSG